MLHPVSTPHLPRIALAIVWVLGICFGLYKMSSFLTTPGVVGTAPQKWPPQTTLAGVGSRHLLLLALHPRCSCSQATLEELSRLLARASAAVQVRMLVFRPSGAPDSWSHTAIWKQASQIPGVELELDTDGREARRFGLATSGHALLYAPDGRLVFSGGITAARGHIGDNPGRAAIAAILSNLSAATAVTRVFGCPLRNGT